MHVFVCMCVCILFCDKHLLWIRNNKKGGSFLLHIHNVYNISITFAPTPCVLLFHSNASYIRCIQYKQIYLDFIFIILICRNHSVGTIKQNSDRRSSENIMNYTKKKPNVRANLVPFCCYRWLVRFHFIVLYSQNWIRKIKTKWLIKIGVSIIIVNTI